MAESKLKDTLTCSICVQMFRDPVVLPCQHSFCSECIGLYVDQFKSGQTDKASCSPGSEDVRQVISCPVCRAQTTLGEDGVAGLSRNFQLAEIVEKFASDVTVQGDIPGCSVCEEDSVQAKAVKFCTICCLLYCSDCLTSLHPVRGGFRRHNLISPQEYLTQVASESQMKTEEELQKEASCAKHAQPLCMYCVPCRQVMCVECLTEHPEHSVRDVQSAAEIDKPKVMDMTSQMQKVLKETTELLREFTKLHRKIQDNKGLHKQDVERAYCAALEDLNTWKLKPLEDINTRYSQWSVKCSAMIKHLQIAEEEMERMVQASKDLLLLGSTEFLQGSKQFMERFSDQLRKNKKSMKKKKSSKRKLLKSVEGDIVVPRMVTVKDTDEEYQVVEAAVNGEITPLSVAKPALTFTETNGRGLRITDYSSMIECENMPYEWWCRAVTNGAHRMGRYYWEMQITASPGPYCLCRVGVVQRGCGVRGDLNPGRNSWYIVMAYSDFNSGCGFPCDCQINPDIQQRRHRGPHHLGLYLDCENRSLTVLDSKGNQLIGVIKQLNLSESLVPFVQFEFRPMITPWYGRAKSASARLVTGNLASLPQILCHMLKASS